MPNLPTGHEVLVSNVDQKREFIESIDSIDSLVIERDPLFIDYLFFHNVLDRFCWLLKLHYADRDTVRKKKSRLDTLFQRFIQDNAQSAEEYAPSDDDELCRRLSFLCKKGWHNELVRSDPLHPDYLRIGTQVGQWMSPGSGGLVAWNIVQSYYAVFEYCSCLACAFAPHLRIDGHRKLGRELNNHLIGQMSGSLLFYPFNLSSRTPKGYIPVHPPHCRYHYATYPRDPGRILGQLDEDIQDAFQIIGSGRRASIFDLLYQLRIWANYTGVESLLQLTDGGYQAFLMKNLATVVYFIGGMAEMAFIKRLGETRYTSTLWAFAREYIDKHERFARNQFLLPCFLRLRAYKHLGLIRQSIDFMLPRIADPAEFIDV